MVWYATILLIPLCGAVVSHFTRRASVAMNVVALTALCTFCAAAPVVWSVFVHGPWLVLNGWGGLDELSALHLAILLIVYAVTSLYAPGYFARDISSGLLTDRRARLFAILWCCVLASMELALLSRNTGIMWVAIESTTLLTAFLVSLYSTRSSLEAMWKYLLMCSVGMGIAFMGIVLTTAAAPGDDGTFQPLRWGDLVGHAATLEPMLAKAGFVFIAIGFGTKAGLAPMHNWLPDAHSQAPGPVSAFFSGFMINAPIYCIMRFMPVVDAVAGVGWSGSIMRILAIVSIVVAAGFIVFQRDLKRLLAYCSVEHMGIICLGLSAGSLGTFAALVHLISHSFGKTVAFLSAGRLVEVYGTHDMQSMSGARSSAGVWGLSLFVSFLALIGVAPFASFLSEFQIVSSLIASRAFWTLGIFLAGTAAAFVAMLGNAISIYAGQAPEQVTPQRFGCHDWFIALFPLGGVLILGLWIPELLQSVLMRAAALVAMAGVTMPSELVMGVLPR